MALVRLKNDKSLKSGIEIRRLVAGWNDNYLAKLLCAPPQDPDTSVTPHTPKA
jgi:hypothetical protein